LAGKVSRDKRYSLFGFFVSDEVKKFRNVADRRIVSFSGTVHVEERDDDTSTDDEDDEEEADADGVDHVDSAVTTDAKAVVETASTKMEKKSAPKIYCRRCGKKVYPMERLDPGPGQSYHDRCFRCDVCKTKLTLATFCKSLQVKPGPGNPY
jgi:LIM domain